MTGDTPPPEAIALMQLISNVDDLDLREKLLFAVAELLGALVNESPHITPQ